jgi:Lar family restriction alleviation protein
METNILPCPFCDCKYVSFITYNYQESMYQNTKEGSISCDDCGAKGGSVDINIKYDSGRDVTDYETVKKDAVERWNTRSKQWLRPYNINQILEK